MFKNKSYRQQFQYYMILSGLAILLVYQFSFSKTFDEISQCSELENKLASVSHVSYQINKIESELQVFNNSLNLHGVDSERFHEYLLNIVSTYSSANAVQLVEFPQQHVYEENEVEIATSQFTAQGSYIKLLKLVYLLEQENPVGRLCNVKFYKEKNNKTKRIQLYMRMMVQNVTSK